MNPRVVVTSDFGLAQKIVVGKHELIADEPMPAGTDAGPSPYELLLSSLGACKSMTIRLYAQRKGWDLRRVTIRLQHYRTHAEDCRDCGKADLLDRIDCEIELGGTLDDEQRQRLFEISQHCPIHRTLTSRIDIGTVLAAATPDQL